MSGNPFVLPCPHYRVHYNYMTFALELERYKEYGIAEGEAKGRAEAQVKDIRNLMETMNLTAEQAMKALKIPASDYAKYMVMV